MTDIFIEYLIKKKPDAKDIAKKVGIITAGVILTLFLLLVMYALALSGVPTVFSIGLVIVALMWYGAILLLSRLNIEYEYILTNSELDIDKVMSKSGRKHLISLDFKNITLCANVNDPAHKHEFENTASFKKIHDLCGDKGRGGVYFIDYDSEGTRERVIFQPTKKMIESAKLFNPRNIFVYEE